jgi:hypothetical protein
VPYTPSTAIHGQCTALHGAHAAAACGGRAQVSCVQAVCLATSKAACQLCLSHLLSSVAVGWSRHATPVHSCGAPAGCKHAARMRTPLELPVTLRSREPISEQQVIGLCCSGLHLLRRMPKLGGRQPARLPQLRACRQSSADTSSLPCSGVVHGAGPRQTASRRPAWRAGRYIAACHCISAVSHATWNPIAAVWQHCAAACGCCDTHLPGHEAQDMLRHGH